MRTLALLIISLCVVCTQAATRPNVLLIITDDQGFGDVASHANPHIKTPFHDSIANAGVRFDRFFVSPVCAPTRASLLTGRYHLRTGVFGVTRGYETIRSNELTIAEALKSAGYVTGAFGKWHNGRHMPNHPNGQGFDEFIGFCGGHWQRYFDANLEHNGEPIESKGYIIDTLTDHAMDFITKNQKQPFFCYVPYNTPHSPWRVPQEWWRRHEGKGLDEKARCAYAMVENIDWNLGRLLGLLYRLKIDSKTIVIFMTDNGANSPRYNAGMKGRKGSVDEGGVRVPFFLRYPEGGFKGRRVIKPIAAHIDVLPTILELCGVDKPTGPKLDGRSLVSLLRGTAKNWPERMIFTDRFRGEHDLSKFKGSVRTDQHRAVVSRNKWTLYDMLKDPGQKTDIAKQHPAIVKKLSTAFDTWFAGTGAKDLKYHPAPIGHPARNSFTLPAHEANLIPGHGQGIKYTGSPAGFSNNWIKEWTDQNAYPEWELNILEAGKYAVEIQYNLAPENVGTKIAIEFPGNGSVSKTLNHPFLLPLVAKPNRLLPADGYEEKAAWKWTGLGTVELQKGMTLMQAKTLKISGGASIELRSVRLTPAL
jgi:arylsulfatase A-like enzyme